MTQSPSRREQLRQAQIAKAKNQRLTRIVGIGAAILAVVLVAVFAVVLVQQVGANQVTSSVVPPNATADRNGIVVNPGKAKPGAPVVALYMDYQCPVCKKFESVYGSALKALADAGEIELQYRTMTFLDNNLGNTSSISAGIGAACADAQGAYSAYHEQVFANQPTTEGDGYSTALLRDEIPTTIGLSGNAVTGFQQCFDTKATQAFVKGTNDAAFKSGVNSTPTLKVNDKVVPNDTIGATSPADLGALIKANA